MSSDFPKPHGAPLLIYDPTTGKARVELEKRFLQRLPAQCSLWIQRDGSPLTAALLQDLSGSGARLSTSLFLSIGDLVWLQMEEGAPPFCQVKVARRTTEPNSYGVYWTVVYPEQWPKGLLTKTRL